MQKTNSVEHFVVTLRNPRMGECSFGNGFGQTNKNRKLELEFDENTWRTIPTAIFKGMTRRYQVVNEFFWVKERSERPANAESVCLHQAPSEETRPKHRIWLATRDDCCIYIPWSTHNHDHLTDNGIGHLRSRRSSKSNPQECPSRPSATPPREWRKTRQRCQNGNEGGCRSDGRDPISRVRNHVWNNRLLFPGNTTEPRNKREAHEEPTDPSTKWPNYLKQDSPNVSWIWVPRSMHQRGAPTTSDSVWDGSPDWKDADWADGILPPCSYDCVCILSPAPPRSEILGWAPALLAWTMARSSAFWCTCTWVCLYHCQWGDDDQGLINLN